jgi:hypothetical protein
MLKQRELQLKIKGMMDSLTKKMKTNRSGELGVAPAEIADQRDEVVARIALLPEVEVGREDPKEVPVEVPVEKHKEAGVVIAMYRCVEVAAVTQSLLTRLVREMPEEGAEVEIGVAQEEWLPVKHLMLILKGVIM